MRTAQRSGARPSRAIVPAAVTYVVAWITGLALGSSHVGPDTSDADGQAHFVTDATIVVAQATLVHLIAGAALLVLAVGLAPLLADQRARAAALAAGVLAGALSVSQAVVAYTAAALAPERPPAWSGTMLETIAALDVVKILLLAVFVAAVSTVIRSVRVPRTVRIGGIVTSALLVLGAASFVLDPPILQAALALSLVLLIAWAGSKGMARRPRSARPAADLTDWDPTAVPPTCVADGTIAVSPARTPGPPSSWPA